MTDPRRDANAAAALISAAHDIADIAAAIVLGHFRSAGLASETKSAASFDPVTAADREAETAMRDALARLRPDDAILGEEFGVSEGSSGLTWILDPIDGTRGYIAGTPTWGVLIACADAQGSLYGLIDQPYIGERFEGGLGRAGMLGPRGRSALACRPARPLGQALLFTTFPEIGSQSERAAFQSLSGQVRLTRYGMDCYAYALLALGQIDLVVEAGLQPYDIAAPLAVVEAAGGIVTDWRGGAAASGGRVLAAANAEVHRAAMEALGAAP